MNFVLEQFLFCILQEIKGFWNKNCSSTKFLYPNVKSSSSSRNKSSPVQQFQLDIITFAKLNVLFIIHKREDFMGPTQNDGMPKFCEYGIFLYRHRICHYILLLYWPQRRTYLACWIIVWINEEIEVVVKSFSWLFWLIRKIIFTIIWIFPS